MLGFILTNTNYQTKKYKTSSEYENTCLLHRQNFSFLQNKEKLLVNYPLLCNLQVFIPYLKCFLRIYVLFGLLLYLTPRRKAVRYPIFLPFQLWLAEKEEEVLSKPPEK